MDAPEKRPSEKPLILILVKRAAILLLIICAISLFYWIVGSVSSFLDSTQSMLLDIMRLSSLGVLILSGLGILLSAILALVRRFRLGLLGILGYIVAAALGGAALAVAQSISILSLGLR
jgi:hypothetical protein